MRSFWQEHEAYVLSMQREAAERHRVLKQKETAKKEFRDEYKSRYLEGVASMADALGLQIHPPPKKSSVWGIMSKSQKILLYPSVSEGYRRPPPQKNKKYRIWGTDFLRFFL